MPIFLRPTALQVPRGRELVVHGQCGRIRTPEKAVDPESPSTRLSIGAENDTAADNIQSPCVPGETLLASHAGKLCKQQTTASLPAEEPRLPHRDTHFAFAGFWPWLRHPHLGGVNSLNERRRRCFSQKPERRVCLDPLSAARWRDFVWQQTVQSLALLAGRMGSESRQSNCALFLTMFLRHVERWVPDLLKLIA